ncbi:hypothetical protein WA026_003322, partial [Henosepilachna vigintioctopunctata]
RRSLPIVNFLLILGRPLTDSVPVRNHPRLPTPNNPKNMKLKCKNMDLTNAKHCVLLILGNTLEVPLVTKEK